jgi:hypothetical protein
MSWTCGAEVEMFPSSPELSSEVREYFPFKHLKLVQLIDDKVMLPGPPLSRSRVMQVVFKPWPRLFFLVCPSPSLLFQFNQASSTL